MNEERRGEALTAQIKDVLDAATTDQFIPWITWILLIINTLVFLIETILAFWLRMHLTLWSWLLPNADAQTLFIMMGALVPDTISQPWRVVTALFLHIGLVHYAMNMVGLWTFRMVEHSIGRWNYLLIYFSGGIVGNAAALLTFLVQPDTPFIAGASSALFSVGTVSLLEFSTNLASRGRGLRLSCFLIFLWVLWIAPMFAAGNPFAHSTGALCGGLIGVFRLRRRRHKNERKMKEQGQ